MRELFWLRWRCGIAAVVCLLFAPPALPAAPPSTRAQMPQYNVLFSRDDKTCNALRDFYNRHLRNRDDDEKGLIEDQFGSELLSSGLEVISERPNWRPPQDSLIWIQTLPHLNAYNDGTLHTIGLLDETINQSFDTLSTTVLVIKGDVPIDDVRQIFRANYTKDPRVEQWINFTDGGSSLNRQQRIYEITEIPPSQDRNLLTTGPLPPAIGHSFQRIIRSENRIYGVARSPLYIEPDRYIRPGAQITRIPILVYSATSSGVRDICYLEFAFTYRR